MALTKVQAEGVNLADNFAFTGTVSGGGMDLLLNDTISSAVAQYDISSTYINSTYDDYELLFNLVPVTDSVRLYLRIFSGGVVQTGTIYAYETASLSSSTYDSTNTASVFPLQRGNIGSDTGEHITSRIRFQNVNTTDFSFALSGFSNQANTGGNHEANAVAGMLREASNGVTVNGCRLYFSSGNIESGTVKLYGLRK